MVFGILIILWLEMVFLEFILFGVCWTSQTCELLFFIKFGKFLAITSSNSFCPSVSPILPGHEVQPY